MAKYGFNQDLREKKVIGLIYHMNFDLKYSYQKIINILNEMGIKTRRGKSFTKSRLNSIFNDPDYQNLNFLNEETLRRVQEINAIKQKEKPKVNDLKKSFNL